MGEFTRLFHNVTIGIKLGSGKRGQCPQIGKYVTICTGAGIYGGITIADNVTIGANAVVTKSFAENNAVIAGVPAKVIGKQDGWSMAGLKDKIQSGG